MTDIREQQIGTVSVAGGSGTPVIQQIGSVAIISNPATMPRIIQLGTIIVTANNQRCISLGPALQLGCWSPCGTLLTQGN